jgi:hypothetical protein
MLALPRFDPSFTRSSPAPRIASTRAIGLPRKVTINGWPVLWTFFNSAMQCALKFEINISFAMSRHLNGPTLVGQLDPAIPMFNHAFRAFLDASCVERY